MPSPSPVTARTVGTTVVAGMAIYAAVQVLTGVEIGVLAATLVLTKGWTLPAALAWSMPIGLPLVLLQGGLLAAVAGWMQAEPQTS